MAEKNTPLPGTGRFNAKPSAASLGYIQDIKTQGQSLAKTALGFTDAVLEVQRRETEARSKVKDPDFTNDEGTKSIFAADANEMRKNIGGEGDKSYDFANIDDIARFERDLEKLNKELGDAEVVYNETVKNLQQLDAEHDLFVKTGEDPNQAVSSTVEGVGDVYNSKLHTASFDQTMSDVSFLRDSNVEKTADGKYVIKNSEGEIVKTFDSKEDYFSDMVELSRPDLQPVPVLDGRKLVIQEEWGRLYKTEEDAESAFLNYVLNNPELAERRYLEKSGKRGGKYIRTTPPEAQQLLDRHPKSAGTFEDISGAQYEYVQEMLQEWRDEQGPKDTGSKGGGSGSSKDILNTTPQIETSITTKAEDADGNELFVLNEDGSVQSGSDVTHGPSAVIRLPDELTVQISIGPDNGELQGFSEVKVQKLGVDKTGPFGIATFELDGVLQSIRIPLPATSTDESMGDFYAALTQQYKMNPATYDQIIAKLLKAHDDAYGLGAQQ
jgi:hypothetical protein